MLALHIIAFDIPFPAKYGGNIDVYNKIKSLYNEQVIIYLHCFAYKKNKNHRPNEVLQKYCKAIFYYPRLPIQKIKIGSWFPYIVHSRQHPQLLHNLTTLPYPILFEGIHTCHYLSHPLLKNRFKMVRLHNIEQLYYKKLYEHETHYIKKIYFKIESIFLKKIEIPLLQHAQHLLPICPNDYNFLAQQPIINKQKITCIPAFFNANFKQNTEQFSPPFFAPFALYHGNLAINENEKAALFLIEQVFNFLPTYNLIIAGSNPTENLLKTIEKQKHNNITLQKNITDNELLNLVSSCKINVLPAFQNTGIKLKLIHALAQGNMCLANTEMVENTGLENLCYIANTATEFRELIPMLFQKKWSNKAASLQKKQVEAIFDNKKNALKILNILKNNI